MQTAAGSIAVMTTSNESTITDAVLDAAPICCVLKDPYGAFVYANRKLTDIFETPTGGFFGKTDYHLMPDVDAAVVRSNDKLVLETGRDLEAIEQVHFDGVPRYFLVKKFLLAVGDTKFLGVFGLLFDATEADLNQATAIASEKMKEASKDLRPRLQKLAEKLAR